MSIALSVIFLLSITTAIAGDLFDVVNPKAFPTNETVNGYFLEDYPVNYFLLSASSDGQYAISYSGSSGSLFIRVYAADPGTPGGENIISYLNEPNVSHYALQAGMYKISVLNQTEVESYNYEITNKYAAPTFSADIEPNDEFVQAASLVYGDVFGHQGYAYDAWGGMPVYNSIDYTDIWTITTEEDGYFIVDSVLRETLEFNLYLYDEDEQLMLSYSKSDTYSNVEHQLAAGTYYIKTDYDGGFGSYMLTTSIQGASLQNDPEPNDERNTASVLEVGGEDTGHIGFATDARDSVNGYYRVYDTDDYWKVTTVEDGVLTVATTSNVDFNEGPFMHLYIYSEEGRLMHSNYNSDDSLTAESSIEVAAGTYYVDVKLEEGYGSYLIACGLTPADLAADTEPNDIADEATVFTAEEPDTGHLGFITDTKSGLNGSYNVYDNYDYWKISYDEDSVLDLTVHLEGDSDDPLAISLYVYNEYYNASGSNIHSDYNSEKLDTLNATLAREAGFVYVRVNRVSGFGSYTISCDITPARLANDDIVNEIADDASTLPNNWIGTGHLGFYKKYKDYNDYWRFDVIKEGTLDIVAVSEGEFGEGPVMYMSLSQSRTLITDSNYDLGDSVMVSYDVTPGTYFVNVNVRDGYGSYTLTVSYPSDEPIPVMILTETLPFAITGEEYSMTVEIDYDGEETVSYELLTSPLWLNISDEGVLQGTPGSNDSESEVAVTIKVFTSDSEDILETTLTVENAVNVNQEQLPNAFHVDSPYPNPFNALTTISYSLPRTADVHISVFNLLGQIVFDQTFLSMSPGYKSFVWHGEEFAGNSLNSGLYFIKVASENSSHIRKALYIK